MNLDEWNAALIEEIRRLSLRYTRRGGDLRLQSSELAARLRFFLPRDLPKIGGPLAELGAAGLLPPGPVWRVLDLGAGLGATSLGVSAFARASGAAIGLHVVHRTGVERLAARRQHPGVEAGDQACAEEPDPCRHEAGTVASPKLRVSRATSCWEWRATQ